MTYEIQRFLRRLRRQAEQMLNDHLPNRPTVEPGAIVSFRAKIEGHAKNIRVRKGARVREQAWLNCMDAGSSIEIGEGTLIMPYAKLVAGFDGRLKIGRGCTIHSFDVLYGFTGGLTVGDEVRTGTGVTMISANHNFDDLTRGIHQQGYSSEGVTVCDHVWIGAGVIILDGVTIGSNTVLGAGSVVTKDMPSDSVCVGSPARVLRRRGEPLPSENS